MLTDQFPGSEIALGIQLKHVASRALTNRTTQGYAASAVSWAKHLDAAIEGARFRGLRDLFDAHKGERADRTVLNRYRVRRYGPRWARQ